MNPFKTIANRTFCRNKQKSTKQLPKSNESLLGELMAANAHVRGNIE
jgi:hypothetical protein